MWERIKSFLKEHGTLVAGGAVGVLVAAYLLLRSKAGPSSAQITFPPSGGGGGSSGGGPSTSTPAPTTPAPIALTLSALQSVWHNIGVSTGEPWNYTQWASGITSSLPAGTNVPNLSNVLTYIWNTINTATYASDPQKAIDFVNSTLNDAIANPSKYSTSGTPVAPYTPPPPAPPPPKPTEATGAMPVIPVSWSSQSINSLIRVAK